jgi:hypothetical protein
MTSLIFGSIYLGHKGIISHRREKQRVKNYERWEGLRDEYDEQRKVQRETRSLDLQRTGAGYGDGNGNGNGNGYYEERPILTLRDQQEADDARTSWRPQETFTPMHTGAPVAAQAPQQTGVRRPMSMDLSGYAQHQQQNPRVVSDGSVYAQHQNTGYQQSPASSQLRSQKTGAVWDDGLPQPLRVSRQNFDDAPAGPGVGRSSSLREYGSGSRSVGSMTPPRMSNSAGGSSDSLHLGVPKRSAGNSRSPSIREETERSERMREDVEPLQNDVPGGRMAELIEGLGGQGAKAPSSTQKLTPANEDWWKQSGAARDRQPPAGEKDMLEWWK